MHKKLVHLIPATLLSFCFACQSAAAPAQSEVIFNENFSFSESSTSEQVLKQPSLPSSSPYWELSNVDISDVQKGRKLLSFTFDDAPGRTLENILAVYAAFNEGHPDCKASGTVFFNGIRFDKHTPTLLHAACAMGFELGNHTHAHADLTTLSEAEIRDEINRTDALLYPVDGLPHHLLRAPFGRVNEEVKNASYTPIIDWTIDTLDWTGVSTEEIYKSVFERRFSGAIVLMHDGYEHTVSALKRLLPDLYADGYQVVSLSKMMKAHDCRFKRGSVYIRARKQTKKEDE